MHKHKCKHKHGINFIPKVHDFELEGKPCPCLFKKVGPRALKEAMEEATEIEERSD